MSRKESPVFPVCTVIVAIVVLLVLPGRYRALPAGFEFAIGAALVAAILAGIRYAVLSFAALGVVIEIGLLAHLLYDMASRRHDVGALSLLSTAVGVWVTNVAIFALIFWQLDRGGPAARAGPDAGTADISFPRGDPADGLPPDWTPGFADYLFLAFTTATAFSPTDALPLTRRAKLLIMAESTISLVTVVAVAARAINILGT